MYKKVAALLNYNILKAELTYHKYQYYMTSNPDIPDTEYDELEKRFDFQAKKLNLSGSWIGWRNEDLPKD